VDERKPLPDGVDVHGAVDALDGFGGQPVARGLHSFTFQLNLSAFWGIGGARRGCVARVKGMLGGVRRC
jgi:hypothetical protein